MMEINSVNTFAFNKMQNLKIQQNKNSLIQNQQVVNFNLHSVPLSTLQAYSNNVSFGANPISIATKGLAKPVEALMEEYGDKIARNINEQILPRVGQKGQFLNWKGILLKNQLQHMDAIYENAAKLRANGVTGKVGVIGIGGSAHTVEAVGGLTGFNKKTEVLTSVVNDEITEFVRKLGNLDEAGIMVVSKSGTTPEPAYGFKKVKQEFEKYFTGKFLKEAGFDVKDKAAIPKEQMAIAKKKAVAETQKRIMVVTDANAEKSTLRRMADKKGYINDVISDDVGGRYGAFDNHVLTAMALEGMPKSYMEKMLQGALKAQKTYFSTDMSKNLAAQKAAFIVDEKLAGRPEFFTYYTGEKFKGMATWFKQISSESLKSEITPATDIATAVQHYRAEADCHIAPGNIRGFYNLVKTNEQNSTYKALLANIEDYYPTLQPMMVTNLPHKLSPETVGNLIELDHATIIHTGALFRTMKGEAAPFDKALPEVLQPNVEAFKANGRSALAKLKASSAQKA